ncbi:MAG: carbohydrate binding domain-containing protein [Bacteroidaceae bacterium]|nr:carbohydrate binding domain-containing protein [Bacteroidaceae bacterium]
MRKTFAFLTVVMTALMLQAQSGHDWQINVKKVGADIPSTMYGIFFEDINYGADGGLYAEKVKNRSFDFPYALTGWQAAGKVEVLSDGPFERNPNYVRLSSSGHHDKHTALINEGFFGIAVEKDKEYRFSVWARVPEGFKDAKIRVELANASTMEESQQFTRDELTVSGNEWKRYELTITSPRTDPKAQLRIFLVGNNSVDLDHVSLFPADAWKGLLRADLVQALADLHPGVFRFPGGCIVEGTDLATRYNWKNSVGPVENRPLNENRWHYTFAHRFFPDYFQTYGLGFYEFFCLAEAIGAAPLPVVSCGLACQFQNGPDENAHVPVDELQPYVQDALDLIEFANGGTDTPWGKLRAEMGHPEPFGLKYLAVGNEQWGQEYIDHAEPFIQALRKQHPEIQIIGTAGPYNGGEMFDFLWPEMRRMKVDLVDEHFYAPERWFKANANRYDNYSRKGPKVFAGEYACHGANGKKFNHFNASLLEAAFMTGLERNADVVRMATYAPLFAHVEGWQWRPDLIWYDNLRSVRTASYYVQQLYSTYKGTNVLPLLDENKKPVAGNEGQDGLYASAAVDKDASKIYVKVANIDSEDRSVTLHFNGLKKGQKLVDGERIVLHADDPMLDNTLENPEAVVPRSLVQPIDGTVLQTTIAPATFNVFVFSVK